MNYCILHGDVLDQLRNLPAESVQTVITSPPYWGLRDYKIPRTIWPPSISSIESIPSMCDPDDHLWGDHIIERATNHTTKARWNHTRNGRDELQPVEKRVAWKRTEVKQGQFCQRCGAWYGAFGLEPTPQLYIDHTVQIFAEIHRVLRKDGTLWLNLGDSYATGAGKVGKHPGGGKQGEHWQGATTQPNRMPQNGLKPKDLVGIPWRVALALRDWNCANPAACAAIERARQEIFNAYDDDASIPDRVITVLDRLAAEYAQAKGEGWYLRMDIIWSKDNPMPESVQDRPTRAHEYIFLMTKSQRYYYDHEAIKEPASPNTHARIAQAIFDQQTGGLKDYGPDSNRSARKTLENLKASALTSHKSHISHDSHSSHSDKQSGHGRRHAGFNERYFNAPGKNSRMNLSRDVEHTDRPVNRDRRDTDRRDAPGAFSNDYALRAPGINPKAVDSADGSKQNASFTSAISGEVLLTRNKRSVWQLPTAPYKEAHFATFPPKLVEPCILAGTSEVGCCSNCGAPWRRIVEKGLTDHNGYTDSAYEVGTTANRLARLRQAARARGEEYTNTARTVGWEAQCDCDAEIVPCIVLDPFMGSGTTLMVALQHARNGLGIELNPDYINMAHKRITDPQPLLAKCVPIEELLSDVLRSEISNLKSDHPRPSVESATSAFQSSHTTEKEPAP